MDAGVLPSDVVLTFGCATDEPATRLLRVDARGDRLVEVDARGRTVRTVDVADVVSFEARAKDDDEDRWDFVDEYARWLDEDDVREWRNTVIVNVASASGRHRKRDDDDDDGVERGEGTAVVVNIACAARTTRARSDTRCTALPRQVEPPSTTTASSSPSRPSTRESTSGVLLLRNRPRAPRSPERAVRCGGGGPSVSRSSPRADVCSSWSSATPGTRPRRRCRRDVRVTGAVSLDESAVATVRRGARRASSTSSRGTDARLALAALDSDPRGAEGWIDALREGAGSRPAG